MAQRGPGDHRLRAVPHSLPLVSEGGSAFAQAQVPDVMNEQLGSSRADVTARYASIVLEEVWMRHSFTNPTFGV
jgi:hypothetical protein